MAEGQSVRGSAQACHVHHNTAFRWRHRFLTLPDQQKATNRVGIVEADETFFLESFKGQKQGRVRAPRKRGGKASKRGLSDGNYSGTPKIAEIALNRVEVEGFALES